MNTPNRPEIYPGYPVKRFAINTNENTDLNGIEIPDGPWILNNSPLPTHEQIIDFIESGLAVDSIGRPLHPWAKDLLSEESGGAVIGKGRYWNWGPNKTADPIVITEEDRPRLLLITRSDTGALALPGGFVDSNENPYMSAIRELKEESGLTGVSNGHLIYEGPVADARTTLNAWAETSAYLFTVPEPLEVSGRDDAVDAKWYYLDELTDSLFGSHAALVDRALSYQRSHKKVAKVLAAPKEEKSIAEVQAGHMAYHHYVASHDSIEIFVKEHDSSQFSDPQREAHSRAYLAKEHAIYGHLRRNGFTAIPEEVILIDDTLLAMSHLSEQEGWLWQAPKENTSSYISDVLLRFNSLQTIDSMYARSEQHEVAASYETFWREGWDAIDDSVAVSIIQRINELTRNWEPAYQTAVDELISSLETIRLHATTINKNPDLYFAHNDARQSNIAWHPEQGARIVDWSWADVAPKNADATMFLIDLAKSGHDIAPYKEAFNKDFALTLIGFWLAHSTWETRDSDTTVREHQIASASIAFQLINSL